MSEFIPASTHKDVRSDSGTMSKPGAEPRAAHLQHALGNRGVAQMLDSSTRESMEQRFGADFSEVRVHPGEADASATHARAYTVGNDIAFAAGEYDPSSSAGRDLLAHELAHTLQQRSGNTPMQAQRVSTPHEPLEREADEAAARIARGQNVDSASLTHGVVGVVQCKDGEGGLLAPGVLTLDWDVEFQLDRPSPEQMDADPSMVLTAGGLSSLNLVLATMTDPSQRAELEGNASIEGSPDYNQELSVRRAQYMSRLIGAARVRDVPQRKHMCVSLGDGLYACGALHAHGKVDPVDRRVRVSMFTPPGAVTIPHPLVPMPVPKSQTKDVEEPPSREKEPESPEFSEQKSYQLGVVPTYHRYLLGAGSGDPATETILQFAYAYTLQKHKEGKAGAELQAPLQLQYSLTTHQLSFATGEQISYVVPALNNKVQFSVLAQALIGLGYTPGGSATFQMQPALGSQISFQLSKQLQLSAQGTAGLTLQTGGPQSLDFQGTISITYVP